MRLLPGCRQVSHLLAEASLAGGLSPRADVTSRSNDMATTVGRERPHSTREMLAVHRVFRRESALMPRLVQAVPDGNTALEQNGHEPYACHAYSNPGPRPPCTRLGR